MSKLLAMTTLLAALLLLIPGLHAQNDMPLLAQLQGEHNGSGYGYSLVTLDFNHDGYDDLIVLSTFYGYQYQETPSRGKVYIYYGGPGFSSASMPAMTLEGDYPEGNLRKIGLIVNVGDINGDGFDDLLIGDAIPNVSDSVRYMFYFGQTANLHAPDFVIVPQANEVIWRIDKLGDIDGDGFDDIGIVYTTSNVLCFDIQWGGSFNRQVILSGVGRFNDSKAIIGIGDIDNDGFDDFSIGYLDDEQGYYFSTVRIYYGNRLRVFHDFTLLIHTSNAITRICKPLGDINNDGFDDFLGYVDASGMKVWFGTNTNLPSDPNVILNPVFYGNVSVRGVTYGDFNGDGYSDIIGASYAQRRFAVWLGNTFMNGRADWQKTSTLENYGYDVAVGDYNGDGFDDIAVSAPFEEGIWPTHDFRGYVFIYAGNPGMVANDDQHAPPITDQLQMRISPNPVRYDGDISIALSGITADKGSSYKIEVYNLKGQIVHKSEIVNLPNAETISTLSIANLASGVYICRAKLGSHTAIKKFTIIK